MTSDLQYLPSISSFSAFLRSSRKRPPFPGGRVVRLSIFCAMVVGLISTAGAQEQMPPPDQPSAQQEQSGTLVPAQAAYGYPFRVEKNGVVTIPNGVCGSAVPGYSPTLNVPPYDTKRPPVDGDYIVIEYNASQDLNDPRHNITSWTDYRGFFDPGHRQRIGQVIEPNGGFLPVVYSKEKIAVRVCGLHFTDVLTVTTSPNGVPEGGADVRGVAAVTPAASVPSTLDMLQSGSATGGTTTQPGLGLGAPAQLPSISISGISLGTLSEDQTPGKSPSYTPANVTASGKQVILLLFAIQKNAMEISRLIGRTLGSPYNVDRNNATRSQENEDGRAIERAIERARGQASDAGAGSEKNAPGSVNGVVHYLEYEILPKVRVDSQQPSNAAAFDSDLTNIQNVNAQISTLGSALSSQAFASNALALLNNYSTLTGLLDLAQIAVNSPNCQPDQSSIQPANMDADDLSKLTVSDFGNWTVSEIIGLQPNQIAALSPDVRKQVESLRAALDKLHISATPPTGDQPLCSIFEKNKLTSFWNSYNDYLVDNMGMIASTKGDPRCTDLSQPAFKQLYSDMFNGQSDNMDTRCFEGFVGETLKVLQLNLEYLRGQLGELDKDTTELYDLMNEWYAKSSVEQTDLLPPLSTNAFVRISIVVQRGYTPFTLANASGTFSATATSNVPATASAANTSTPAHSVKTILVEVHRLANFNIEGGAMFIHIPTANYAIQASPTPATASTTTPVTYSGTCGGNPVSVPSPATPPATGGQVYYGCVVQSQQTEWQLAAMAGLVWFPWGHDYFPRRSGFANYGRNLAPSVLVATSVSTLGNSMVGVNWEPVSGIDFSAGLGSAHRTVLPSGITVNTAVSSGATLTQVTQEHAGFTFGFGVDLSVFTSIFGAKTSAASQP